MPKVSTHLHTINGHPIHSASSWKLQPLTVSESEIISFAKVVDPLPFHTSVEEAKKSHFGTLVAPGTMMYSELHKRDFIPLFGSSILAGQGIYSWMFYQPHYPDHTYSCTLKVLDLVIREEKQLVSVFWHFPIYDEQGKLVQEVKVKVLHKLDAS